MKITKKTYNKNVKKFAKKADAAYGLLVKFAKKIKLTGKQMDELCSIIDTYVSLNVSILEYAYKNNLNKIDFYLDVYNSSVND